MSRGSCHAGPISSSTRRSIRRGGLSGSRTSGAVRRVSRRGAPISAAASAWICESASAPVRRCRPPSIPTSARSSRTRPCSTSRCSRRSSPRSAASFSRTAGPSCRRTASSSCSTRAGSAGVRRAYALQSGDVEVDRPEATTILGAVKLTGKQSGWTYGALTSLTADEEVEVLTADGVPAERPAEPTTSYNVVRLQRDIRQGTSNVGMIATGVMRKNDLDAAAAGGDFNLRWDRNRVNWNGHWAATRAPVSGAMQSGFGGVSNFNFDRKHGGFYTHFDHFNPTFRVDDLGFFRGRPNRTTIEGGASAEQPDPWKMFRRVGANMFVVRGWNEAEGSVGAPRRLELLHAVQELLGVRVGRQPSVRRHRRPRHQRGSADRDALQVVPVLLRRRATAGRRGGSILAAT